MSPKRSLSPEAAQQQPEAKRPKVDEAPDVQIDVGSPAPDEVGEHTAHTTDEDDATLVSTTPTLHSQSRQAIQRSIAMVLKHDGFDTATPEALEGFTQLVETYLQSIIGETKRIALLSRREQPIPIDYERVLKQHNVPISSLRPHLRHPLSCKDLTPTYSEALTVDEDAFTTLPLLSEDLSGQEDKDVKPYIPKSFPDFPSRHTYRFTPQEDLNVRDSKKIREQAARTAQQGEDALRRLVRASKMRKQKEVKSLVERDSQGKERYRLWEATMKRFVGADSRGEHTDQVEVADHSMIVNGDGKFSRKEVPRAGKRSNHLAAGNATL